MMELIEILRDLGLTDEKNFSRALETFSIEYNLLTGDSKALSTDNAAFTDSIFDILTRTIMPKTPRRHLDILQGLPQQETYSISEKISKMMQAEGPEAAKKVNEYTRIAAHVYGRYRDSILSANWKCLGNSYQNIKLDDETSGLKASLYKKEGARPKYVYAIAGTNWEDPRDWIANYQQMRAGRSIQYDHACEIAEKLASRLGSQRLITVGHSKGGGQAAYCSLHTGCQAITFNPAGLLNKPENEERGQQRIHSYVMVYDPLNLMQMLAQFVYADLTADGSVHYLKCAKDSPVWQSHGIETFLRLAGMKDMHRIA